MIKVKISETGQIVEVTRNIAHDLIDKGKATIVMVEPKVHKRPADPHQVVPTPKPEAMTFYPHRELRAQIGNKGNIRTK
jgi:hypothetical protein